MFTFTTDDVVGDQTRVSVTYQGLIEDLEVGDTIMVNNGLVIFRVEQLEGSSFFQGYSMLVYRSDGTILWKNREEEARLTPADVGPEGLCYAFFQQTPGGSRYLETVQRLELNEEPFYVDLLQTADQAFSQRDANLRIYRQVLLLSVGACTLASIAGAAVLLSLIHI